MRYRNKLTGSIIDTNCLISGEHWERCDGISPEVLLNEEAEEEILEKKENSEVDIPEKTEELKEEKKDTKKGAVIKPKGNVGKKGK